ncbi:helix-turn-helix domain-containing protein [Streptococcus merionis]|uniref:helix-turn-helix domain-containing protein n=1 Tax=Streptococcus merionis TaxID=400065 RepID=UPI00351158D9
MIKNNLKRILEQRGISINKLSNETGISRPTLTSLANNESQGIQFETLEKILVHLKVSLTDLFEIVTETNIFSFKTLITPSNIQKYEHADEEVDEFGNKTARPSKIIPYSCAIKTEKGAQYFNIAIGPFFGENEIIGVRLLAYRDEKGKSLGITDVEMFFDRLSHEKKAELIQRLLANWYKLYSKISIFNFSPIFVVTLILLSENKEIRKHSFPANITETQNQFLFTLFTPKELPETEYLGDEDFSNGLIFEENGKII